MSRHTNKADPERWFLEDRAIESPTHDRLDHESIAAVLVRAVESAHPPCMIGLLAEFGRGKSSTANMAIATMNAGRDFDAVRVSADKHSGNARARNLVHSIAGELEEFQGLDRDRVAELLRPMRQSTEVEAPDPTTTALSRLISGRYEWRKLGLSLLPFAVITVALAFGAYLASGTLRTILGVVAVSPLFLWIVALTFLPGDTPVGSLLIPGTQTDQTPRAEAADEIEEVFGQLVDYHTTKRKRRLVVFVDDIDRLSKDDLLDALRALRSLQSVPRGREPVFVIACNERIVEKAVGSSTDRPAETPSVADDDRENDHQNPVDPELMSGTPQSGPLSPTGLEGDHSHPALAFIDKLLTVRVQMPPTLRGDMRRFAHEAIPADHPLRTKPDVDLERILAILIHDGVDDPRSVIRLANRFISAYLLGCNREVSQRIYKGDVTLHLDVVAQLAVITDEFPDFYDDIARNTVLLAAASKAALSSSDLSPSETDALARSNQFGPDSSEPLGYGFRSAALRRYLASTARLVRYPADISPLVYFTATPGGRILGVEVRNRLVSALRIGDPNELASVLDDVPADRTAEAAEEIADVLREASTIDAPNFLAAVAPNLNRLPGADAVADAGAELLGRAPSEPAPVEVLTALIDHADPGRDALLCDRLVSVPSEAAAANSRLQQVCLYLVGHARVRKHVEPALLEWLSGLPDQGGWSLARGWVDAGAAMIGEEHAALVKAVIEATVRMVRDEKGFSAEDAAGLVELVSRNADAAEGPDAEQLTGPGPNTKTTFVRIWQITGHHGTAVDAEMAGSAAADVQIANDVRGIAVELLAAWADIWKDGTYVVEEQEVPAAPEILKHLTQAADDRAVVPALANRLSTFTAACGSAAAPVADRVLNEIEALRDQGETAQAEELARNLFTASTHISPEWLTSTCTRLLSPIAGDVDPNSDQVAMAMRLIAQIEAVPEGEAALTAVSESWANRLRAGGTHDDRCLLQGFQELAAVAPAVIEAKAGPIYSQVDQLFSGNDDVAGRLRTFAQFPWPDPNIAGALNHLQSHWDTIPDDARLDALRLSTRSPDGSPTLTFFNERISESVSTDPGGAHATVAASALARMTSEQRANVFAAAAGHHPEITATWKATIDDEASDVIAEQADPDQASRLLDQLAEERRAPVAAQVLTKIASLNDVTPELVDSVATRVTAPALQQIADVALETAADPENAESSLQVALGARRRGANLNREKINGLIISLLPDGADELGRLLGTASRGGSLNSEATDTLKQLRKATSPVANAFDSARG